MNGSSLYAEASVVKKYEGKYGKRRIFFLVGFLALPPLLSFLLSLFISPFLLFWLLPVCLLLDVTLVPLFYSRFFKIEYDYRISGGELNIAEIYNKRGRRDLVTVTLSQAEAIAPFRGQKEEDEAFASCDRTVEAASSMNAEALYFGIFRDAEDPKRKILIFFEPTEKMISVMRIHFPRTVLPSAR